MRSFNNRQIKSQLALAAAAGAVVALFIGARSAQATSGNWTGATDSTWSGSNWDVSPVPGTGETATFNSGGNGNTTIDLGAGVTVGSIVFDSATVAAYTIGSGGVGAQTLTLDAPAGNSVTVNSTVTANQRINANIVANNVDNTLRLVNSSTTNTLTVAGTIESTTAAAKTINTTGNVFLNGAINPGAAASISIANVGPFGNTLTLGGTGTSNLSTLRPTASGTIIVDGQTVNVAASSRLGSNSSTSGRFELRSGAVNFNGGITTTNTVSDNSLVMVSGGAFTASSISLGRTSNPGTALPAAASATAGLVVTGGTANVTGNVDIGTANSAATALVNGGSLTVGGRFQIGDTTNNRYSVLEVRSGSFTSTDATVGVVLSTHATTANRSALLLTGGTSTIERLSFGDGDSAAASEGAVVLNGGTLYMGSGGIVKTSPNAYTTTFRLTSGTLGAKADWSSSVPMSLNGTSVTIKAADASDNPFNIALNGALTGAGTINKTGGGTLTLGGSNWSGLTPYNANIAVNAGGLTIDTTAGGGSYGGVISGAGTFTKAGTGSLTLSNPQTYTAATTVAGGILAISGTQATSGVTVNNGATLALAGNATVNALTLGATTGDAQTLRVNTGAGINNLNVLTTGALVAHGTTTVDVGTVGVAAGNYPVLDYAGTIGGTGGGFGAFTLGALPPRVTANLFDNVANSSIDLQVTAVDLPRWTGAVDGTWDIGTLAPPTGTQNWKAVGSGNTTVYLQSGATGDQVLFDDTATGTTNVNIAAAVSPSLVTVNNATKNYTFSGAAISGPTQLIKQGTGTLTLSNAGNDYTGGTSVQGGTLRMGSNNILPAAGTVAVSGGTLDLNGFTQTLSGPFVLDGGTVTNGTISKTGSNFDARSGTISSSAGLVGAIGLDKTTAGTLVISNFLSYNGGTNVTGGTLQLGDGVTNGFVTGDINNSATVAFNNATNLTFTSRIIGTTGTVVKNGPATLTFSNAPTGGGSDGNATINGGTVVLVGDSSGAGTYNARLGRGGRITINNGATVLVQNSNALGLNTSTLPASVTLNAGGTLHGDFSSGTALYNATFAGGTLSGEADAGWAFRGDYIAAVGTTSNVTAPFVGLNNTPTFNAETGATLNISSVLSGTSGLEKTGPGTVAFTAANTYTGGTTVNGGNLQAGHGDAFGVNAPLTVNAGGTASTSAGLTKAMNLSTLTLNGTGTYDLNDNGLVIRTGSLPAVYAQIKNAFENGGSFDWNGTGIRSTAAAAQAQIDGSTGIGVTSNDNLGYTDFQGVTGLTGTSSEILMTYTFLGDSDLDLDVDGNDFLAFLTGISSVTGGWEVGDSDYDGDVDSSDFLGFLTGLSAYENSQMSLTGGQVAALYAQAEAGTLTFDTVVSAVVPEPATAGVLAIGALGLLSGRRRHNA